MGSVGWKILYSCAHFGEEMVKGSPVTLETCSPAEKPDDEAAKNGSCI